MSNNMTQEPPRSETATGEPGRRRRGRLHQRMHAHPALALTTKIVVTSVGVLVIIAGLVMMVAPGPGILGVIVGLAILATEWDWADRWLRKARQKAHEARMRAEQMDPRVRRRRLVLGGLSLVLVAAVVVTYVVVYDWPGYALDSWDWLQSMAGWVPDLPGM